MGFILQLSCKSCGYKTSSFDEPNHLISPMGMPQLCPYVCNNCHQIFQRQFKRVDGESVPEDKCVFCGSDDIKREEATTECPQCGSKDFKMECIGTFF